ncbi:MAG: hypothetical protein CMI04_00220 [Oceanospirillaceae bacterium]|nr:hypothetical protein [Oceanospirillaceae bacterium]|tara:strand:- start:761 stop:1048 length:288 start_codon:yes stop_codon:yes gene_type:complete
MYRIPDKQLQASLTTNIKCCGFETITWPLWPLYASIGKQNKGIENVVTIAQQGQGGDRCLVTDDAGRVIECESTSYAKSVAARIGFQDAQIKTAP